jgi:hypothetical protein
MIAVTAFLGVCASAICDSAVAARWWTYGLAIFFLAFPGGAFTIGASIASPAPEVRQMLGGELGASFLVVTFCAIVVGLFAGNARERLRYSQ